MPSETLIGGLPTTRPGAMPGRVGAVLPHVDVRERPRRNQGRLTPQQTAALDELGIGW